MPTPAEALTELQEMSPSIRQAVIVRGAEDVLASTYAGGEAEGKLVSTSRAMLDEAKKASEEMGRPALAQMYIESRSGCVFIVSGDNDTWLAATTGVDPTVGLVLYDVSVALRSALEGEQDGD